MTYKSHLINFCYLPYLHLNFPIGTIAFLLDFARLKTLCLFYFSTTLIVYLFCTTSHHHFPSLWRKKRIRRKKSPYQYRKVVFNVYFCGSNNKKLFKSEKSFVFPDDRLVSLIKLWYNFFLL